MSDLKFSLRRLAKSPGFTTVVVLTLALCIGANSAIFSVLSAVLLQPLPYPEAERLVTVNNSYPKSNLAKAGVSIPDYLDRVERAPSIESAALITWESFNLAGEERPVRVLALRATPSLFPMLRAAPTLGRVFSESEAQPGNDRVVVLGHALWKDHFGGRADILGETIRLHGVSHTVIGVMPSGFEFPQPEVKLWVPFAFTPEQRSDQERGNEFSTMYARLKPGATPARLQQECATLIAQNLERLPDARSWVETTGFTAVITPVLEETVGEVRSMLWLVQAGVVAALLIGCANVGNLLLTRVMSHQRELAIRSALGAGHWRLVRQIG
ncbi:MAG: ABC transporter permease, partial [Verrucomicrobiae bacterium]|nr:ABC transporter permease [Verrucomicrobiae bacterium]